MLPTVKAVYWRESSAIFTCQNPLLRSIHENIRAPTRDSIVLLVRGSRYESFLVRSFRRRKSIQKRSVPSFFCAKTTALHHGDCEGTMVLPSNISCMCCRTSSTRCGAIRQNRSLKGSPLSGNISITCFVASVQPFSWGSREKI